MIITRPIARITLIVLVVSLAACSGLPRPEASSIGLSGGEWQLRVLGGSPVDERDARVPTLRFDAEQVSGSDGCNRISGSYSSDGQRISFGQMTSTRMACMDGMALAQAYTAALTITQSYCLDGEELVLYDGTGQALLRFVRGD